MTPKPLAPSGLGTSGLRVSRPAPGPGPAGARRRSGSATTARPVRSGTSGLRIARPDRHAPGVAPVARSLPGPSGPGTSGLRIARPSLPEAGLPGLGPAPGHPEAYLPLPYGEREWGDGTHPPLYAPATARINEGLGEVVNDRLVAWARRGRDLRRPAG